MSETSQQSSENDGKCHRPRGSRKRQVHNEVERRRKDKINGWISKIAELLPRKDLHRPSKINILEQTVDYIKLLVSERDKLLSENCSEVQAEEIKKLKKDLDVLSEQNALYVKLLEQSNISLRALPKKALKYSNKFVRKNGVLTVKNAESNVSTSEESAVQVSTMCLNIPASNTVNSSIPCESSKTSSNGNVKSCKAVTKTTTSAPKPVKIVSAVTTSSVVQSCAPVNSLQSNTSVNATLVSQTIQQSGSISQENVIPIINWNDPTRNSAPVHAGGVTTVLSQFPVMSTTLGSSFSNVYNKNVPTLIIPTGGNILQHFPAEKPSNTISIICPSTLPILVPQQVLSVPSMARNVGLPPTIICPGPVDNSSSQPEKSTLGSALLTINPSSVVPISSSFSANTRIILPSQPTLLGNACGNVNLTPNVIPPLLTTVTQSDDLIVPLVQKLPVSSPSKSIQASTSDTSCENNVAKNDNSAAKIVENNLDSSKDMPITTSASLSTDIDTKTSKISVHVSKHPTSRSLRNLCSNSPPSLQVLSANKIISFANQTQNSKKTNLKNKPIDKTKSFDINKSKPNESAGNLFVQMDLPVEPVTSQAEKKKMVESCKKTLSTGSEMEPGQTSDVSAAKSNFSLTVLMGDCLTDRSSQSSKETDINQKSPAHNGLSSIHVSGSTSNNNEYTNNAVENIQFSNISETETISSVAKENSFASVQILSNTCNTGNNTEIEKQVISNSESNNQSFSSNSISETLNGLSVSLNTSDIDTNALCNFNNLAVSSAAISTSSHNLDSQIVQKENSESINFPSKDNLQPVKTLNDQNQSNICSEIANSVNNTFNENVPFTMNESSINQALLPSLFSSNQINLNSQVLVCHTGHENATGIILPHGVQVTSESTNHNLNPCLLHDSSTDFHTFSVLNKDLPNSMATMSTLNDHTKKMSDTISNFSVNSSINTISVNDCNKISDINKTDSPSGNDCNKQFIASKKKNKSTYKESRVNSNDKNLSNSEVSSDASNNTAINKIPTGDATASFSKNDSSNCSRQDSNFIFTSDILARATESIFANDILESPQMPKRNEGCFSDDTSNLNIPVTTTEKGSESNYKIQYSSKDDHNVSESPTEKNPKNISGNDLQLSNVSSTAHNIQGDGRTVQEMTSKPAKLCKIRKSKPGGGDPEPPCKKLKEMSPNSDKSTGHVFNISHQNDKESEKTLSNVHSNLSFLEKQVSSPSQTSVDDQTGVASMGNFANHIHLSDSSCKTPSSVDAIFSLTPMLGDILKDVSHNVNLDSRNTNFGNENQAVFPSEKNFISFNYPNNSNEDYLNLPRMYFPIIPEISTAPVVHVTNVSFAHSVSLCSTQSDSQKTTETHSSSDSQIKTNKKKDILPLFHSNHNVLNLDLTPANSMSKQSECVMKANDSEAQFNASSGKVTNTMQYEGQHTDGQTQSLSSVHSTNLAVSQSNNQYNTRDNFTAPVSHTISFYPTISSSSNIQNFPCATTSASHVTYNNIGSIGTSSVSFQTSANSNNSYSSQSIPTKSDNLSHSLCSLLKENSNIVENRGGTSEPSSQSTSSSNIAQSKYSALSLISDQTPYSESVSTTTCHQHFVQSSTVYTTSGSDGQFVTTVPSCSRNPKTSLSYSAESLLQTSCASSDKNKNNKNNNRFQLRTSEKKIDRNSIANIHSINDTNIFLPVTSCDINIQNTPLIPLPPVTSFHNFPSTYTVCDTVPSTTIFNSVTRTPDIPLSLSSDNFLNHMNLNVESQMLSNRHEVSATVPKAHSNITLPFENHNALYNNCNFLPHVKPALESSRSSEASACFQPSSYSNNYTQQSQKPNCCHFSHRTSNSDISSDINLPTSVTVTSFHNEKNNFQNRAGLQTSFSQSNSNFMGNFFYNTPASCHDGNERNDMNIKPSTIRPSQEVFVPDGVRQSIHDQNAVNIFNSRKTVPSNRNKSKKPKSISSNENINVIPTCISNYSSSQDNSCNKANISYVPNGYFKSTSHPVLPGQIQCSQNKMSETVPPAVIPTNPSFNPVLHQQTDSFLNLNFQHTNFTMSPLPRPPTQPLSCSCLTTPIISHTFSSTTPHPVPNFNLSNILPDMGCSSNQVSFSPAKFPMNHSLSSSSTQCQTNSTITNSAHIVSHQSCAPSLYPPHPPMVRGTLNPILGPNSQTLIDSQVSLVGSAGSVMSQNTTFAATQNPTFRNVIHSITFPRNDR